MIKKLLAFAGGEQGSHHLVRIGDLIHESESILKHTLPKTIRLFVDASADLALVMGDPTELSQVIMNLAINARDAMANGGQLTITATNIQVDTVAPDHVRDLASGPYVWVRVADTGQGIEPEIIERIFDPFFTTKEQGKGTGLGLATSIGIARSHHGILTVKSVVGVGSEFEIFLPAAKAPTNFDPQSTSETLVHGNGETVLIIDDEANIRESAMTTLQSCGYRVMTALSGTSAVDIYRQHVTEINVIVLDMMMPGIDGMETADRLRRLGANVPIVATSGLRRPTIQGNSLDRFEAFLPKPYTDVALLKAFHRVLHPEKDLVQ